MKFQKTLFALPLVFSLAACSCGNKISPNDVDHSNDSISPNSPTEVIAMSELFRGKVADRVFFATDKSTLNHESKNTLKEQAALLKSRPELSVVVEGHCDERGPREYNIALGERRAHAAKEFLCHSGANCDNISTVSYGKERPEVQGHDAEAWAQNRRAVTVVAEK
jgi:peptidoglycan-associated lipoprotein